MICLCVIKWFSTRNAEYGEALLISDKVMHDMRDFLQKAPVAISGVKVVIFHFLWDHWAQYGTFEDVLDMYMLEGVSSVANVITAYEEPQ